MPPSKLSRPEIVTEAIALLREEGLENVSLRKLAARLQVEAPSLYWHISSKGELFALMCESIFVEAVDGIGPSPGWQDWLRQFGRRLWASQFQIHDIGRMVLATDMGWDRARRLIALVAERLAPFGIDAPVAARMQFSVQALVIGWGGYAFGPNAPAFEGLIAPGHAFDDALDVLVAGWEQRLNTPLAAAR